MENETPTNQFTTERSLSAEIKLYYDLQSATPAPAPLLIALHGYGASKRQMMREAQAIVPEGFRDRVVAGAASAFERPERTGRTFAIWVWLAD